MKKMNDCYFIKKLIFNDFSFSFRLCVFTMRRRHSELGVPSERARREPLRPRHHLLLALLQNLCSLESLRNAQKMSPEIEAETVSVSNLRKGNNNKNSKKYFIFHVLNAFAKHIKTTAIAHL